MAVERWRKEEGREGEEEGERERKMQKLYTFQEKRS